LISTDTHIHNTHPQVSEETENHLRAMVHEYLADTNSESELNVGPHMHKIRICFRVLKQMYCEGGGCKGGGGRGSEEQEVCVCA
jgi:hypothetical protein